MFVAVKQYIEILSCPAKFTKTLGAVDVLSKDASGHPNCFVGNKSVVFKIRREGRVWGLKCYTCPKPNLRRIYGERCLREEMLVSADGGRGEYVDVVLTEWIEGRTLHRAIADAAGSVESMRRLSESFDRFALGLLEAEWAHGDLKPENIIVDAAGEMHAIDFDGVWRPDLADLQSDETGTAAFQHPLRRGGFYDKSMDDYPVALISTALHALAADLSFHGLLDDDRLLIDPAEAVAGRSAMLDGIERLFEERCMGVERCVAAMLRWPVPRLHQLRRCMEWMVRGPRVGCGVCNGCAVTDVPHLVRLDGLCGYLVGDRYVIPPVFDDGFEFSEGTGLVVCGRFHHFLSPDGGVVLSLGNCDSVKPFRNGRAVVVRSGRRMAVDCAGRPLCPPPMRTAQK